MTPRTPKTAIETAAEAIEPPIADPTAGDVAIAALQAIAALNAKVQKAHTAYAEAQTTAKDCRELWQGYVEQLQTLIELKTRPPELPLFDATAREADLARMTGGAA